MGEQRSTVDHMASTNPLDFDETESKCRVLMSAYLILLHMPTFDGGERETKGRDEIVLGLLAAP